MQLPFLCSRFSPMTCNPTSQCASRVWRKVEERLDRFSVPRPTPRLGVSGEFPHGMHAVCGWRWRPEILLAKGAERKALRVSAWMDTTRFDFEDGLIRR